MRFDLADLRLFIAIVEAGSITHGAKAANLSLAAASERLREMEISGGVALLARERRGVTPTRAGDMLLHHARLILRQVAHMRGDLSDEARGIRATVRLLANAASIAEFLPERLGPWLAAHPQIDVDLAERLSDEIVKAVAGGLAEIGIVSDAVPTGALETRPFALDQLVVVTARDHSLAAARQIAFAEVLDQTYIGFTGVLQDHIDMHAARAGHKLRPRIRLRTFDGICRMAADGAGLGIVPEAAARRCRRGMPIAILRLTDQWAARRLLLCCRNEVELDPAARRLFAHLAESGP